MPQAKVHLVRKGFWQGLFSLALILGIYSFYSAYRIYSELGYLPTVGARVNEITYIHRPYFGLIQTLSFSYVLSLLFRKGLKIHPVYYLGLAIAIISVFLVVARLSVVALIIVCLYFVYEYLRKRGILNLKTIAGLILFMVLSISVLSQYNRFSERFIYLLQGKGEPRILIWECAYRQFTDRDFNIFLGNRSASTTQDKLNNCYKEESINKTYWAWIYESKENFNTHNEYLNMLLSYGILGLILLLALFLYLFFKSRKEADLAAQFFVIVFAFNCFTENLLARQDSIFIFCICAAIIIYYKKDEITVSAHPE
nr:O-antigen ligase family protein [Pontibacter sp. 172403-2]